MRNCCFFFLLLFSGLGFSQSTDKKFYLDEHLILVKGGEYAYYRVVKDYYEDLPEYEIKTYYASDYLFEEGKIVDKEKMTKQGLFTYYYDSINQIKETLHYDKNVKLGTYNSWHPNGKKCVEGVLVLSNQLENRASQLQVTNYWDENGEKKVENGFGFYSEKSKKFHEEGPIEKTMRHGEWKGVDRINNTSFTETYKNGKFLKGVSIDDRGKKHSYNAIDEMPSPKGGISTFYEYIGNRMPTPAGAQGKVIISFVVSKEGNLIEVKAIKSLSPEVDREAIRVIAECPRWHPGKRRGLPIRTSYQVPIVISPSR